MSPSTPTLSTLKAGCSHGRTRGGSPSLLGSARQSFRRKASSPYRSAMSMLTFYMNRAGSGLDEEQREILDRAKDELRRLRDEG